MKQVSILAVLALSVVLVSCGGPTESVAMKEAKDVHEQLVRISGELHDVLMESMAPLEGQMDSAMMAGDTLLAAELAKLEGKLDRIDVRFHDWSETVVEIPGQACTHDHDHSGHDHDGHDHRATTTLTTTIPTTITRTTTIPAMITTITMELSCLKAFLTPKSWRSSRL